MYGEIIYKGQTSFYGHNSEKRLHSVQYYIHRKEMVLTPDRSDMCKLCQRFDSAELHFVPTNKGKALA